MLMALLYRQHGEIAAAALACDVVPVGDRYWQEMHIVNVHCGPILETAIVEVDDPNLQRQLLKIGIDDAVCGRDLDRILQSKIKVEDSQQRAA